MASQRLHYYYYYYYCFRRCHRYCRCYRFFFIVKRDHRSVKKNRVRETRKVMRTVRPRPVLELVLDRRYRLNNIVCVLLYGGFFLLPTISVFFHFRLGSGDFASSFRPPYYYYFFFTVFRVHRGGPESLAMCDDSSSRSAV